MYIMDDGIRIHVELERPVGAEKCPLVIVLHGFTGHMEEKHIVAVSNTFLSLGCAVLRCELYGHGSSGGSFHDHTLFKWLGNTMAVIDHARRLDDISEIYLCGHSQGGLTVMLAAAMERDVVRGILPLSPASMIPEQARRGELLGIRFDPAHIPDELGVYDGRMLGGNYARVAQTIHVEDAIDHFDGPVLIVHGTADESVPVRCAQEVAARYKNCTLALIEGDTHCYDHHLDQVLSAVRHWMKDILNTGRGE